MHMTQQSLTIERDIGMTNVYDMPHVHGNVMKESSIGMDHYVQRQRLFDGNVESEKYCSSGSVKQSRVIIVYVLFLGICPRKSDWKY